MPELVRANQGGKPAGSVIHKGLRPAATSQTTGEKGETS
jgi:hypothetical protein